MRVLPSLLLVLAVIGCSSDGGGGKPTPGREIRDVEKMLAGLERVKDMRGLVDALTNESAASLGLFVAAFAGVGAGLAEEMAGSDDKPPEPATQIARDLEALVKRYGIDDAEDHESAVKRLGSRGRQFFRDVLAIVPPDAKDKDRDDKTPVPDPSRVRYEVIGPTRVDIIPLDEPEKRVEARWEDGRWRLHFGTLQS
jgi:hypothetical protein